jgi:hypothetical protein
MAECFCQNEAHTSFSSLISIDYNIMTATESVGRTHRSSASGWSLQAEEVSGIWQTILFCIRIQAQQPLVGVFTKYRLKFLEQGSVTFLQRGRE